MGDTVVGKMMCTPASSSGPDGEGALASPERAARFASRTRHLPKRPLVVFFSDHHRPDWPGESELSGLEDRYELSRDPLALRRADIVVVHLPQVRMWHRLPRAERQIWVGVTMEPDGYYPWQADLERLRTLDLLISYHAHADIRVNYTSPGTLAEALRPTPPKDPEKLVCAFISQARSLSGRERLIKDLEAHVPVHHFGKWRFNQPGTPPIGRAGKLAVLREYQFCLAFENCVQADYVTEKWFDCLQTGCVPVYLGAPNIRDFAPSPSAFLEVRDCTSAAQIADSIRATRAGTAYYAQYFSWKKGVQPTFAELYENENDHLSLLERIDRQISFVATDA